MILKKIYLHHFRNYTEAEFAFSSGINWIVGKNGVGKTNLLEAIYLLSTGRSFRTAKLSQLIQEGSKFFYIEAEIELDGVTHTLKISFDGEIKRVIYNSTTYSHFSPLIGLFPQVLYAPDDSAIISGIPSIRRKFMDLHISQIDPLYLHHLTRYYRAMHHRNELLKKKSEVAIEPWEESMAVSAQYLIQKRAQTIAELLAPLHNKIHTLTSTTDNFTLKYHPSIDKENILQGLCKMRKKELHFGTTLYGPHRDDIHFFLNDLPAKSFASMGQKHSIIAALHFCEWEHFKSLTNRAPFFSIDDFGVHLDAHRQAMFQKELLNFGQIFLTTPKTDVDSNYIVEIQT